ncbi:phosphatidylserine decarboxylase-domain-containing protein [Dissophora ornata]|nr:phosphatidylserine decarboxylase-domain-containing protein [Dissophora ornata]
MSDIPIARDGGDPSIGFTALRLDTPSPPPGLLTTSSSNSSTLSTAGATSTTLHGVVFMEIVSASNLPRTHNVTRTGFDMDPFVVISFGKYIFRTRVIRHNLNPTWRAKLMFRVHHGEENFTIKYSVHDWDKLSGNDYVGMATMDVDTLIKASSSQDTDRSPSPVQDAEDEKEVLDPDMKDYALKITIANNIKPPADDTLLQVRAKFVTYTNIRRRFWLGLAKAFDADPRHGLYSKILIQAMLEGLGSNLSSKTVDSFFTPYSKDPEHDELTFDELFERLERQVRLDDSAPSKRQKRRLRRFWLRKSNIARAQEADGKDSTEDSLGDDGDEEDEEEDNEMFLHLTRNKIPAGSTPQAMDMVEPTESDFDPQTSEDEYVIRIASCPICRDPSLNSKLETDVITHIAVCSGNDGFNLDKLILGNFVTEANAQRKWITKVVKTLGYGRYVIGKSNANIIVQDRTTGVMLEEKMPAFIRLGIRLLYKSPAQKIRVGKILANMSRKQGLKFDDPRSKRSIEPFIRFHNLEAHMSEVLEPVKNFKTFNEFFYRRLKPDARTLASPGDDRVAVSVADCRMTCFQTITDAQKFWIKGRQFTVAKLLGDEVLAKKYDGGSLAVFRLAPQDYHRYHIPVRGILSKPESIAGEYFTVNPMAIRSHLDVFGENKRVVSTIESKEFGTVAYCAIGAMMVGSIVLTTQPGQEVERMEEHGYFAFGGSTIVVLFEPNSIQFDEDLLRSSKEQIEMLVRVGMRIGVSTRQ